MAKWVLPTMEEDANGDKCWRLNGKRHREDGPAIEWASGGKEWHLNGELHREDGPAIDRSNGYKAWYLNGERHREDGPAVEGADGGKEWWLNGKEVTEEEVMGNNTKDNVNSPSHYNQAGIECIDAIKASLGDEYQDYCKGNVMKYLWRYKYKNGIEDLKKAQWYLNSMVDSLQEQEGN